MAYFDYECFGLRGRWYPLICALCSLNQCMLHVKCDLCAHNSHHFPAWVQWPFLPCNNLRVETRREWDIKRRGRENERRQERRQWPFDMASEHISVLCGVMSDCLIMQWNGWWYQKQKQYNNCPINYHWSHVPILVFYLGTILCRPMLQTAQYRNESGSKTTHIHILLCYTTRRITITDQQWDAWEP